MENIRKDLKSCPFCGGFAVEVGSEKQFVNCGDTNNKHCPLEDEANYFTVEQWELRT